MYASRHAIFFLVFLVALVSALPLHNQHRRSKCRHKPSVTVPGATPTRAGIEVPSSTDTSTPSSPSKPPKEGPKPPKESSKPNDSDSDSSDDNDDSAPSQSGSGDLLDGLLGDLFPVTDKLLSWTTSPSKDALPIADSTFRPKKEISALSHDTVDAPDGKKSMKAHYPKGSYNFGHNPQGGFSFYAPGPKNVDLSSAKEATFAYSIYFPEDFDWVKGGKLPGIYGGNNEDVAIGCSGGRRSDECFSARLMWRDGGKGEVYTYLPPSFKENEKVCDIKPESDCNPTYGASVGRGSFSFEAGKRTVVSQRIKLNDVGKTNGEIQLFVGGKSVINVGGLVLRNNDAGKMWGIQMQTFFGGSHIEFATPKAQDVYFSDFSVAITEKLD